MPYPRRPAAAPPTVDELAGQVEDWHGKFMADTSDAWSLDRPRIRQYASHAWAKLNKLDPERAAALRAKLDHPDRWRQSPS